MTEQKHRFATLSGVCCFQAEEADDDDIYNVLSTLKRLTAFHKYVASHFAENYSIIFKNENNEIATTYKNEYYSEYKPTVNFLTSE